MDSKDVLSVNPSQLTDSERDEIAEAVVKEDFGKFNDVVDLRNAVKLLHALLVFKVDQVVSLGLELDEQALKQGEEEAHLLEEIEDLRAQLSKGSKEYIQNGVDTEDELRQLLQASELNAQKLLAEVQAQEQEHLSSKEEIEKLESQLAAVENDRLQLKLELSALKEEVQDQHKEVEVEIQEPQKKNKQLVESLRLKNRHLSLLLNDIEASEKENIVLKEKLTSVKIELAEATKNIMHITGELVALQITKEEQAEKLGNLEQMCEGLRHQVRELVDEKEKHDTELESFQKEIDVRVQEWKDIVTLKEKQLHELREQVDNQNLKGQHMMKNSESEQIVLLTQTLQKREAQIDELKLQLSQATKDLNATTLLLENMHRASELSQVRPCLQNVEVTQKQLTIAEDKIQLLEGKLKDAENDADGKSEEITKLIIQLRSYEAGEFGLTEALAQIKELSKQRSVRDKHIEQLVETANQLRNACDTLQEENLTFREQLNISPEEVIQPSAVALKTKEDNVSKVLQQQIDRLEEDLISARMDKRNLTHQVLTLSKQLQQYGTHIQEVPKPSGKQQNRVHADARAAARKIRVLQQEQHQLNVERQSLIEENEALRQGLHDILDSVHKQDGKSSVRLESQVLEQLLHALDSRHISGWYHPAMRIQAKVNAVEGNNEALREQLHCLREEELKAQSELQKSKLRIAELERKIPEPKVLPQNDVLRKSDHANHEFNNASCNLDLPSELSSQGLDIISKLNKHLLHVLHDHQAGKTQKEETVNIQRELNHQLDALVFDLAQTVHQQSLEKEKWHEEKNEFQDQLDSMQASLAASESQVSELKSLWDRFSDKDKVNIEVIKDIQNFSTLLAEKKRWENIAASAQSRSQHSKRQLQIIKSEWNTNKEWFMKQLGVLLQYKKTSLLRLYDLELVLAHSVPLATLDAAKKQIDELATEYSVLLRQHEIAVSSSERDMKKLISELELEKERTHALTKRIEEVNKKLSSRNVHSGMAGQDLSAYLEHAESEAFREREHASHATKMCEIIKVENQQVSKRCLALEEEVTTLLNANLKLKAEVSSLRESSLLMADANEKSCLESQLASAKVELLELQASQEYLKEMSDISQAQVQMLDQLHERSEHQLDSLRQVLYKLQDDTDMASEVVRLGEELCASQVSEMAAWNQVAFLQEKFTELVSLNNKQAKELIECQDKINVEKKKNNDQCRKIQEEMCASTRNLWGLLDYTKEELASQIAAAEEKKTSCQQTLELQNALQTHHSDVDCQRKMESWAAELTAVRIKNLKYSRRCESLESSMKQTLERLERQEILLSLIEQQLLSLDIKSLSASNVIDGEGVCNKSNHKVDSNNIITKASSSVHNDEQPSSKNSATEFVKIPETPKIKNVELLIKEDTKTTECTNALNEKVASLSEEIIEMTEVLKNKESELESCRSLCGSLKQLLSDKEHTHYSKDAQGPQIVQITSDIVKPGKEEQDKAALQATVDSLKSIVAHKEDTIARYQKFLQDVREEDGKIISALQEHLQIQQAYLTAQEQAYVRLKISMRHLSLETNSESNMKSSIDEHLTRSNELEDEVTLLNTKVIALSSDLQRIKQEASYWRSIAQQHLITIDELNARLLEYRSTDKGQSLNLTHNELSTTTPSSSKDKKKQNKQERCVGCRDVEEISKTKANQVQNQLSSEITELRTKVRVLEEHEHQLKNEIQRLRAQIPIYSRRIQQPQNEPILPEREEVLLKRVKYLEHQIDQQKIEHEKSLEQHHQQSLKKIKSAENIARWDERKKHQMQIQKLKSSLQEQTDELALFHNKVERLHSTVHRLEREKIALEHRIRNLLYLEQDKIILEDRLKTLQSTDVSLLDELQKDRDKLSAEVRMLRAKECEGVAKCIADDLRQERDKLYAEVKMFRAKEALSNGGHKNDDGTSTAQKGKADFLKANLELECDNLELKLDLEKLRSEVPCLRHKIIHLERLLQETQERSTKQCPRERVPDSLIVENENLRHIVRQLSERETKKKSDHDKILALESELSHKSSLLSKVKGLLERAAMKEKQLQDQVHKLEMEIEKR